MTRGARAPSPGNLKQAGATDRFWESTVIGSNLIGAYQLRDAQSPVENVRSGHVSFRSQAAIRAFTESGRTAAQTPDQLRHFCHSPFVNIDKVSRSPVSLQRRLFLVYGLLNMSVRHAAVVVGLALGLMSTASQAAYIVNIEQVGADVVATGSGSIDISGFTYNDTTTESAGVVPNSGVINVGTSDTPVSRYNNIISGPSSFGAGDANISNMSSGAFVSLDAEDQQIGVPVDYVSGTQLGTSNDIFYNQTLVSLGLIKGSYTYTFINGESEDSFTINVGSVSAVPLPASAPMFGAALFALGAVGYGAKRKGKVSAAV